MTCFFCGQPVDPRQTGVFRRVEGWVQSRSGGGSHAVTFPKNLGEVAHETCMNLQRMGVGVNQSSLF